MSQTFKERCPLLGDDLCDEGFGISCQKSGRSRQSSLGRAKTQALGAAFIINRWPDHFSSLLTYLWIGLIMIVLIVFVTYNSVALITALPAVHPRPLKLKNYDTNLTKITTRENYKADVFLHIFTNGYEDPSINNYLKYIEEFSKKHSQFKYNVIVISKVSISNSVNSGELNNEIALNLLMIERKKKNKQKFNKNSNVKFVSLCEYMENSPLKKFWRDIPQQFYEFLARCISIWDKGGIAFDPLILTQNSPNTMYYEKIQEIFYNIETSNKNFIETSTKKKIKKKVNNIQDIIKNLEADDNKNITDNSLSEAEDQYNLIDFQGSKVKRNANTLSENVQSADLNNDTKNKIHEVIDFNDENYSGKSNLRHGLLSADETNVQKSHEVNVQQNILPMFLEYFYHRPNSSTYTDKNVTLDKQETNLTYNNNNVLSIDKSGSDPTLDNQNFHRVFSGTKNMPFHNKNNIRLTIDINGYILATKTPCHAFIGSIFSNIVNHSYEDSLKELIISELSIFCKGVLSLCNGIDVILR